MDKQKRGLVLAVVALVAVLALGLVGYGALSKGRDPSSTVAQTDVAQSAENATESGEAEGDDLSSLADYDATVYTDSGDPVLLSAIANGRPLVINFWATWCPYCIREMPDYQQLYEEYGDRVSFAFVDQADGSSETVDMAKEWLEQNGYGDLPAYYDTDLEASYMFGARSLPTTIVVSADGKIQKVIPGMIDSASMRTTLDSLV